MNSQLLGVTYSEFDNTIGPKLLYTYPLEVMSKGRFEELSDYVIVGKHLCKKIIVIKNDDIQYMNYSIAIDNVKYDRNSLLFSLGFILADGVETEPFEPILKKLSLAFLALENESEFLFLEATKPHIQDVLKILYEDLVNKGETFINLNESNILTAKIFKVPKQPIEIYDYNVPILRYDRITQLNIPWDISLNYLLGRIDGISSAKKLASRLPPIDMECVKLCLRTLLFYDCVIISDMIQLSNIYQLQSSAQTILCDDIIMMKIRSFCSSNPEILPNLFNLKKFLLKFRPGKPLSQVIISAGVELLVGIDVRRLIAIAQDYQVIKRLHEYPIYMYQKHQENCNDVKIVSNSPYGISDGSKGVVNNKLPSSHLSLYGDANMTPSNAIKTRKVNQNRRSEIVSTGHLETIAESHMQETNLSNTSSILTSLKGELCLDCICCTHGISPTEILDSNEFYIVYK